MKMSEAFDSDEPATAICLECSGAFTFDAAHFASRSLRPPRRCGDCRRRRGARLREVAAVVDHVTPFFAFARVESGDRLYIGKAQLVRVGPLRTGDPLVITIDPEETPATTGFRRRAIAVRPA